MFKIGSNIRKIRTVKGLSQTAFAELFDIKRANIGAYEEGRAEPKLDLLLKIANYFSISIETILTKEVTVNELTHFPQMDGETIVLQDKKENPIYKNHFYVSSKYFPNYIQEVITSEFRKETVEIVMLPKMISNASHLFEINMANYISHIIGNTSLLLAVNSATLEKVANDTTYLLVLKKGLFVGKVEISKDKFIICDHFSGEKFPNKAKDILEVWEIETFITKQFSSSINSSISAIEKRLNIIESKLNIQ